MIQKKQQNRLSTIPEYTLVYTDLVERIRSEQRNISNMKEDAISYN